MRVLPLLLTALLLLVGLAAIPPPAKAAPIFFEDDFRGCVDGTSPPPGWTVSGDQTGAVGECDDAEFFPNPQYAPGPIDGADSFHILKASFSCCPIIRWESTTFSISGAASLSFGFAFRYSFLGMAPIGLSDGCDGGFTIIIREGLASGPGICVDGDDPPNQDTDSLFALDDGVGTPGWVDTGINLVNNTWYLFRMDVDRPSNRYTLFLNDTLISTRVSDPVDDYDNIKISARGTRLDLGQQTEFWLDWFFTDQVTVDPIPDQVASLCGAGPEQTLLDAGTDATTDVIFGLDAPPSFLSVVPATGRVLFKLLPPEGPPPVGPTFPVNLTANVSTGEDFELFNVTFTACDPLGWIREFGPAWVVFLAVASFVVIILLTLWRGAKARPGRR